MIAKDLKNGKFKSEAESKAKFDEVMSRIKTSTSLADTKDCDLVVEVMYSRQQPSFAYYLQLHRLSWKMKRLRLISGSLWVLW